MGRFGNEARLRLATRRLPFLLSTLLLTLALVVSGCREPFPSPSPNSSTRFHLQHPELGDLGESRIEWRAASDLKRELVEHTHVSIPQGKPIDVRLHSISSGSETGKDASLHVRIQQTLGRDRVTRELTSNSGGFEWKRRAGMRIDRRKGDDAGQVLPSRTPMRHFVLEPKIPQEVEHGALTPYLLLARKLGMTSDRPSQPPQLPAPGRAIGNAAWEEGSATGPLGKGPVDSARWFELPVHQLRDGRPTLLRLQHREDRLIRLGDHELEARRFFVQTPSSGHTLWMNGDGELLGIDHVFGGLRAVREGFEWPKTSHQPAPDSVREEEVATTTESAELAGTLSLPRLADRPMPGVILIHGSGPTDRDASPFMFLRDIAHGLSRAGFAVVRYDKRGVGSSRITDPSASAALQTFAGDAASWLDVLEDREDVDSSCLVVIGHSEGGYLAPLVARNDSRVSAVVMLAGAVDNLGAVLPDQLALIARAHDVAPDEMEQMRRSQDASFRSLLAPDFSLDRLPKSERDTVEWMRSHLELDAPEVLKALDVPVFALYAGGDLQIPVSQSERMRGLIPNLPEGSEVLVLDDLDHLFMDPQGVPGLGSMLDPDRRIDPGVIPELMRWLGTVPCVDVGFE